MICVVSHDAGGAEIISSYIRQEGLECLYVLDGPAIKIFNRKLGKLKNNKLEDVIDNVDWILCGTGWQSDLEWDAINLAKKSNIKSIAYLDHWVNYPARFIRHGITCLPNEIWVGDKYSEKIARNTFPEVTIKLEDNVYFKDVKREIVAIGRSGNEIRTRVRALYVCEPIREHALSEYGDEYYWGYVEEDALRYFLDNIQLLNESVESLLVRPHPSDSIDKYDGIISEYDLPISRGGDKTLFEEVAESDIVVGCESMAMVIGLLAGKRVVSCIPPEGKECELPQPEIEYLRSCG
jgi:hypothetical protein